MGLFDPQDPFGAFSASNNPDLSRRERELDEAIAELSDLTRIAGTVRSHMVEEGFSEEMAEGLGAFTYASLLKNITSPEGNNMRGMQR